jgi:hypothetical protein
MSKIILVETVSTFRHVYAVELEDHEPAEYALDEVVVSCTGGKTKLEEFSQQHIAEDIFSHRVISEEEYIRIFDEMNDYIKDWTIDEKKKYIYKSEKIKEVEE